MNFFLLMYFNYRHFTTKKRKMSALQVVVLILVLICVCGASGQSPGCE